MLSVLLCNRGVAVSALKRHLHTGNRDNCSDTPHTSEIDEEQAIGNCSPVGWKCQAIWARIPDIDESLADISFTLIC